MRMTRKARKCDQKIHKGLREITKQRQEAGDWARLRVAS